MIRPDATYTRLPGAETGNAQRTCVRWAFPTIDRCVASEFPPVGGSAFGLERRLSSCQPRDGDAEGRTAYIVQSNRIAERYGRWIAAMFTTDPALELRAGFAAARDAHLYQLTNAGCVETLERIGLEQLVAQVIRQERIDVITAVAKRHLRQVIRTKTEEIRVFGNIVGG